MTVTKTRFTTISLTEEDIREIIAEYVGSKENVKIDPDDVNIELGITTKSCWAWGSYQVAYLRNCNVVIREDE